MRLKMIAADEAYDAEVSNLKKFSFNIFPAFKVPIPKQPTLNNERFTFLQGVG